MMLFTTSEAAAVSGLTLRKINRLIDEGPLENVRKRSRTLSKKDVLFLKLRRDYGELFSKSGRAALYRASTSYRPSKSQYVVSGSSQLHGVDATADWMELMVRNASGELDERISKLERARQMVVSDPKIRGGEPVFKGTRIPAHMIAELVEKGAAESELAADYRLSAEQLELAVLYANAYPKRGRPPKRPWRRKPIAIPD
jgi:uncharacterized protein (DUF433 family)